VRQVGHLLGLQQLPDGAERPRRRHAADLLSAHRRERVAHTVQQELTQRGSRHRAAARTQQRGPLQSRHAAMHGAGARRECLGERFIAVFGLQQQPKGNGHIERPQGGLRRHTKSNHASDDEGH
jgi:hypothetical protein